MAMQELAIIVVNYRCAELVGSLLRSIAREGIGFVGHVVVVDNASGDGSVDVLKTAVAELKISQRVQVLEAASNGGFGAGNNIGARAALRSAVKPDILWFLNPDTLVDGLDITPTVEWFNRDSSVGIVGTGLDDGNGGQDLAGHRSLTPIGEFVRTAGSLRLLRRYAASDRALDRPGPVDWVSGASLMMRASTFEHLGGFDEDFFLYFEEVDLCQRARDDGWRVIYEPRTRVVHLQGQSTGLQAARARPRYWYESRSRYFVKHYGVGGLALADTAWALGKVLGLMRRRVNDGCHWSEVWRCDIPVILGCRRIRLADES